MRRRLRVVSDGRAADSGTLRAWPKAAARCYAGPHSRHPVPPVAFNPVPGTGFLGRDL
ncbi:hypothetical protein BSLA_02f3406 [Burkholderia stabilis]|nr:hypothetical protein BSLA_02f3406 [Burkholderia stabilis]